MVPPMPTLHVSTWRPGLRGKSLFTHEGDVPISWMWRDFSFRCVWSPVTNEDSREVMGEPFSVGEPFSTLSGGVLYLASGTPSFPDLRDEAEGSPAPSAPWSTAEDDMCDCF
jgi:hypothetical protein